MPQSFPRHTLVVVGAQTYLGEEVARFGRALGHRIIATADQLPARRHPWMHGVHWVRTTHACATDFFDGSPLSLLYCDTTLADSPAHRFHDLHVLRPRRFLNELGQLPPQACARMIFRSSITHPLLPSGFHLSLTLMEKHLSHSSVSHSIARLPLLYGPDRPDSVFAMLGYRLFRRPTLRVETAALALLRLALETDREGSFPPAEIAAIGDVMIAQ